MPLPQLSLQHILSNMCLTGSFPHTVCNLSGPQIAKDLGHEFFVFTIRLTFPWLHACEQAASIHIILVTVSAYLIVFRYRLHKGRHFIGCMRVSMQLLYWVLRCEPISLSKNKSSLVDWRLQSAAAPRNSRVPGFIYDTVVYYTKQALLRLL